MEGLMQPATIHALTHVASVWDVLRALPIVCAPMAHKEIDAILTFRQNDALKVCAA